MTDQTRHVSVIAIGVLVIAMGGGLALATTLTGCNPSVADKLVLVATGIVGGGITIITGEFGLARSTPPPPAVRVDHPVTINQQGDRA